MKGIRDLSSIREGLFTLKATLFSCSSTFLCLEVLKAIKHLDEFDTFEYLCSSIRVEVITAINHLTSMELEYLRAMGELNHNDPAFDFLSDKVDVVRGDINQLKKFL